MARRGGGGGGGGGGGKGGSSGSGTSAGDSALGGSGMFSGSRKNGDGELSYGIIFSVLGGIAFLGLLFFLGIRIPVYLEDYKKRKNLEFYLGIALARIVNIDLPEDSPDLVELGLGVDEDDIDSWVTEIFEVFDGDGNGYLDYEELDYFVMECFRTAGIKVYYRRDDVGRLFSKTDANDDGQVTPEELKTFLMALGHKRAP